MLYTPTSPTFFETLEPLHDAPRIGSPSGPPGPPTGSPRSPGGPPAPETPTTPTAWGAVGVPMNWPILDVGNCGKHVGTISSITAYSYYMLLLYDGVFFPPRCLAGSCPSVNSILVHQSTAYKSSFPRIRGVIPFSVLARNWLMMFNKSAVWCIYGKRLSV